MIYLLWNSENTLVTYDSQAAIDRLIEYWDADTYITITGITEIYYPDRQLICITQEVDD